MYDGGGNGLVCLQSITVYTKILSMGYFMLSFLKKSPYSAFFESLLLLPDVPLALCYKWKCIKSLLCLLLTCAPFVLASSDSELFTQRTASQLQCASFSHSLPETLPNLSPEDAAAPRF